MLEGLRQNIGLSFSRLHFRNKRDRVMNFTDAVSRSKKALVIFPESSIDNDTTSTLLRYLLRKFSIDGMMVLIRDDQLFSMSSAPPIKTLTYSAHDINRLFLPRRELINKMKTTAFDIALDLNMNFVLPSAYLCKESNAPVRVSFTKRQGDQFYNFQITTKKNSSTAYSYRSLLKCLDMF